MSERAGRSVARRTGAPPLVAAPLRGRHAHEDRACVGENPVEAPAADCAMPPRATGALPHIENRPKVYATRLFSLCLTAATALAAPGVRAEGIPTHVLDLVRGVGGQGVPVTLEVKNADGGRSRLAAARTDENGRVRSFGEAVKAAPGVYRLSFDMSGPPAPGTPAFFPEINVVFRVTDAKLHHHVPVVVSPFGYSTHRGNEAAPPRPAA